MDALDLLAQDNYIIVNKTLIKEIGLENAIVLGVLCGYQRTLGNDFYREQEKIIDDTGLTEYLVRKSIRELQEYGFIDVVKKGMPCKYYYSINLLKFNFLSSSGAKIDTTSGAGFDTTCGAKIDTTNNNKNNNNKNNNNKNNNNKNNNKNNIIRHKYGEYGRILLTDEQYQKLCEEYNKEFIDDAINKVDAYVESNNNKNNYKNFYVVVKNAINGKWCHIDYEAFKKNKESRNIDRWLNDNVLGDDE